MRQVVEGLEDVGVGLVAASPLADGGGELLDAGHPPSVARFLEAEGEVVGGVVLVVEGGGGHRVLLTVAMPIGMAYLPA